MQVIHTTNHNCHLTRRAIVPFIVTCYLLCCALCSSLNFSNQIAAAITESTTFTVDNSSTVLEITVPSVISLDLHPTTGYAFGTTNLPVSAGTNNPYGLTLTMSVPNLNLTNTDIVLENNPNNVDTDEDNHPIIQNLADGSYTESNFTINRWGYKLSTASNYTPMPTTLELLSTESAANATTTTLNLAAKVDTSRPAGTYSTAINFVAVGNAAPVVYYTVHADTTPGASCDNFTGGGEYQEGENVTITCDYHASEPCLVPEANKGLYMNGINVTSSALCHTRGRGPIATTSCTFTFSMPSTDVLFSTCGL